MAVFLTKSPRLPSCSGSNTMVSSVPMDRFRGSREKQRRDRFGRLPARVTILLQQAIFTADETASFSADRKGASTSGKPKVFKRHRTWLSRFGNSLV